MSIELPPLPEYPIRVAVTEHGVEVDGIQETVDAFRARERILLARIAELERLWQSAEARYAEADAAAMLHAKRIAELSRQLAAALEAHDSVHDALSSAMKENAELEADASLIAAAPDLLDALRQWAAAERDGDEAELANARRSRDAAIAKAERAQGVRR